jgi:probable rRNA maturation factor
LPDPLASGAPDLVLVNRQRAVRYEPTYLSQLVRSAYPDCLSAALPLGGPLAGLLTLEFSVVGARGMARVHREFLGIPGPTDVITFPYGEIVVCASVAATRCVEFGHTVTEELALYCIHGLLHLAGHDDRNRSDAARMHRAQEKILKRAICCLRGDPPALTTG